ncbi:MAG: site-specific integrase [Nitrospira sp.]|nr:site-specific integrase [Candidatus Manganitrophaceae bacterium]
MGVKVRERPLGSGKWWIFTDYKGKRCARYIRSGKREADKIAEKIASKLDVLTSAKKQGVNISIRQVVLDDPNRIVKEPVNKGPKLEEYASEWIDGCETRGLKHTTCRSYKGLLDKHLLPALGDMALSEINRKMVKELAIEKRKAGSSPSTVRLILGTLSVIFTSAIDDDIVAHNPALRPSKFMKMRGKRDNINPFTHEEETIFLQTVQEYKPRFYPLFLFLLRTGCRIGEAVAVQHGDLDFHGRFIEIRQNWTNGQLTTPKNGKTRRVDMSKGLAKVLKDHLTTLELEAAVNGKKRPQWVFPNEIGGILDPDNLRSRVFYKVLEKAELRRIRIHDLRHTFCSRLITNNESLAYIRDQMGHSSIQVTVDLYGHLVPGSNKQAVDRLDEPVEKPRTEEKSATIRNQD